MLKGHGRAEIAPFTTGELRGILVAVGYNVTAYRIHHWTRLQRLTVWKWAVRKHLSRFYDVCVPPVPPHVLPFCPNREAS